MRKFFKTVAVVTIFSVSEKFLGFLYRIYLSRTIGAEGIGLYQVALSVFALLLTACCSGTPITVSRLMTKYKAEGKKERVNKVITAGLSLTLFTAIPLCLAFFFMRGHLGFLFADSRCESIFLIVLPGLIFTSVYSVLRGVFWGNKDFLPYSIIELLEEICMIVVGIVLISFATDVYQGAFRAGVAVLVSYVFSFTLATIVFFIRKNKLRNPISELKPLITSAAPVTAMRTANSFAMSLVSIILPLRLIAAGISEAQAMSMFGAAMGQSIPILFIPTTLIGSFTLVLVPEMAENYYKKNYFYLKRDIEKALKFTIMVACVFIPVFTVCGEEIGIIIFDNADSGKYLSASAFLMLFMAISNITTSMLNSIGKEHKTLIYFIISAAFMLLSILFLPRYIGIYSLLVGFVFVFGLTALFNLRLLNKECVQKPQYLKFLLIVTLLTLPVILFGFLLKTLLLPALGILFTFFICSAVLVIAMFLLYLCLDIVKVNAIKVKFKRLFKKKSRA